MRLLTVLLILSWLLSACVAPPVDSTRTSAPVRVPEVNTVPPVVSQPKGIQPMPASPNVRLPSGWSVLDPKGILDKVEYRPEQGGVLFTLKANQGLELFSAEDAEHRSYYKGRLNNAHLVTLPSQHRNVLIIFTNRQNARSSVLLKYHQ